MKKEFIFKGYRNKGIVYVFNTPQGQKTVSSNACRWEDARTAIGYSNECTLVESVSFRLLDGKNDDAFHTDVIWAVEGTIPSGKATIAYLVEVGAITEEQAKTILDSKDTRL